jgi:hypothetical protein
MVPDGHLAHTSPLSWEHIDLPGDFPWDQAAHVRWLLDPTVPELFGLAVVYPTPGVMPSVGSAPQDPGRPLPNRARLETRGTSLPRLPGLDAVWLMAGPL